MAERARVSTVGKQQVLAELAELSSSRGTPGYRAGVDRFLAKHRGLAKNFARKYRRDGVDMAELLTATMQGLWEAVDRWKPGLAKNFTTYAYFRMRFALQTFLWVERPLVRAPWKANQDQSRLGRAQRKYAGDEAPSAEQLAKDCGLPLRRIQAALKLQGALKNERFGLAPGRLDTDNNELPDALNWSGNQENALIAQIDAKRSGLCEDLMRQLAADPQSGKRKGLGTLRQELRQRRVAAGPAAVANS